MRNMGSTITLMVLAVLDGQDLYGYQIVREIRDRSKGLMDPLESSIYPSLTKALKESHVEISREERTNNRLRVYYHLTDAGKNYLEELTQQYLKSTTGIFGVIQRQISIGDPELAE
jgi:PadR family transcriptional regulator PadR